MKGRRWKLATVDTWPDLRVTIHPLPWCWRLIPRFYADHRPAAHVSVRWLCLDVQWWAQDSVAEWFFERPGSDR